MMEKISALFENPSFQKLLIIAIGVVIILLISALIKRTLNRRISETDKKYKARKAVNMLAYLLMVCVVLFVYSDKLGNVGIALGMAGAGVAFALQEIIVSLAGWLTIMLTNKIRIGDRVKIGDLRGDIIDIGILSTTVMEVGDWVNGDLYNGRIVSLSNSFVYKERIHNYSSEYPFLWDELTIPIRTGGDPEIPRALFAQVLQDITGDYVARSEKKWTTLTDKYRVEEAQVKPMVTLQFDENWTTYTLRYIVDYKKRRGTKDQIYSAILSAIGKHPEIQIATAAIEVTKA